MPNLKTCSRPGCSKTLRAINVSGQCSSGCLSPDAPASVRAGSSGSATRDDVMVRFRKMARLLGQDPEEILRSTQKKVAQAWLDKLEAAVK